MDKYASRWSGTGSRSRDIARSRDSRREFRKPCAGALSSPRPNPVATGRTGRVQLPSRSDPEQRSTPVGSPAEFFGFTFHDKNAWIATEGNQERSQFALAPGPVMVADPDAYDDGTDVDTGLFNAYMSTSPISMLERQQTRSMCSSIPTPSVQKKPRLLCWMFPTMAAPASPTCSPTMVPLFLIKKRSTSTFLLISTILRQVIWCYASASSTPATIGGGQSTT